MAGIFSGITEAKARKGGNYIRPCAGIFRIDKVGTGRTRKNFDYFCFEMTHILDLDPKMHSAASPGHAVGEGVTWMTTSSNDSFLGNVKTAISQVLECDPEGINEEAVVALCSDEQPIAGMLIEVHAILVKTRAGDDFTRVDFKGQVPPDRMAELLDGREDGPELEKRFFSDGSLRASA